MTAICQDRCASTSAGTTLEARVILRQFLHTDPVAISYLFGCGGKACGAVVDPVGDVVHYLDAARATGMNILYVIDTHIHADHVSAGRPLAEAAGAEYVLFSEAEVRYRFRAVRDGEVLPLGNVTVEVVHTPGHTPGHTPERVCLLVADRPPPRARELRDSNAGWSVS